MATVDSLDIQISAQVNKANASLTTLINRLDRVSASLSGVNSRGLATMGAGINKLANAMSNFSANTKTADFSRLSRNIASISNIDTSKFSDISSKMSQLSYAFNSFGAVPEAAQQIGEFARNISKLGNKGITNAITNIPQLAVAIRNLMQTLSTAPVVSQNVIQMTNALANLASQGGKVGTASRTMVSGLNNTSNAMNRAKRSSLGLAAAFGKFYATWFLVIRGIKGFMKSVESTTDYIEAYNYYNVAFGKIASEWDKDFEKYGYQNAESYAESFTKRMNQTLGKLSGVQVNLETGLLEETGLRNLGLNIQEITQYASQLASVTNSIGQTGEVSLAAAKSMTMLAGDISSLFNISFSDVAQNINSAIIGQSRAVYRYGIDITNATLQTYAYNLGLEKSVSEMTQAEKMQLRMLAILDQSKVSWGDLANTISSPSNMLRQFKNNVKELGMVFGQLFIPVLQKVMPVINGVTIALKRLLVSFANILGIKIDFDAFGQGYSDLGDDIDDVSDSLDGVAKSAKKANAGLRAFDELKVINLPDTSTKGIGAGGDMIDLTQQIVDATSECEKVWDEAFAKMENTAQEWADKIEKIIEPIKKIFEDFAIGDFFQAGKDTSALVSIIFNFFSKAIEKVDWYGIGKKIGDFLAGIDWTAILSSVGKFIWEGLNAAIEFWKGSFSTAPFETALTSILALPILVGFGSSIVGIITKPFSKIWGILSPVFAKIAGLFAEGGLFGAGGTIATASTPFLALASAFIAVSAGLGYVFLKSEEVRESFSKAIGLIQNGLNPIIVFFNETILPDFRKAWDKIIEILNPFSEFLQNVFTDVWKEMINPALAYIGETVLPTLAEAFENLWSNVLVPRGEYIENTFIPIIEALKDALEFLWINIIKPLAISLGKNLGKAFESVSKIINGTAIPIVSSLIKSLEFLRGKVITPLANYVIGIWVPMIERAFKIIGTVIDGVKNTFSGVMDFITGVFTLDWELAWQGIVEIFGGIFGTIGGIVKEVFGGVIDFVNGIIEKINKVLDFAGLPKIPKIGGEEGEKYGNTPTVRIEKTLRRSVYLGGIRTYETGGFPEDGWFRASYGEIIGQFDNGKSVVANNMQITQGIADAVYPAVYNAVMAAMRNNKETNITFQVEGDPNGIFKVTQKKAEEYFRATGKPAYPY